MTQGIYKFPQESPNFRSNSDRLPPHDIEAEEAILGGILLDPEAIYRIKDRLKPEHFYVSAHRDIYQACLRLCNKEKPTDMLSVTRWLSDHDILSKVGGRNKLATVFDRTVSAVNIDVHAESVIEAFTRRYLNRVGEEINELGYRTELDIPEIFSMITEKVRSVIELPIAATKDEHEQWLHDRLLNQLTTIYTTCSLPSLRLLKLKKLADDHHLSTGFLEQFYLKSLIAQCTKLLTYDELRELAGSTVREWLLNGLIPKSTTILLASDGGVGKTKFAYAIGKILIQGTQFGSFVTTGKRRILYYQGDESPGDMLQALDSLGYSENDIGDSVRVRFGWSAENMPTLIQDLKEFQPEIVFIDSLSTANRFSVYRESEMEYARPILEMTGLATQYKTTFVIIHHMNKGGEVRGTTAIRNAVSEVWTLSKDNKETATAYDRILEIDKSRSRSSSKKYRMYFNPEDLSFTFLGEEGEEFGGPAHSAKESTLQLLADNRNIKFTSEEIAYRLGISRDYARRFLNELSADGLISVKRQPGKANAYFLAYEGSAKDHPSDHPSPGLTILGGKGLQPDSELGIKKIGSPQDHPQDHPCNLHTVSNTAEGDPQPAENSKKTPDSEILTPPSHIEDHLSPNALPDNSPGGDPVGDPSPILCENIQDGSTAVKPLPANDSSSFTQADPGGDPSGDPFPPSPLKRADIEEGGIYWSPRLSNKVKVIKLFKTLPEAEVYQAGDIHKLRVKFSELYPLPLEVGDEVTVLSEHKKFQDRVFTVSGVHPGGIWIEGKTRQGTDCYGPFQSTQLKKMSG